MIWTASLSFGRTEFMEALRNHFSYEGVSTIEQTKEVLADRNRQRIK
jgi:hypothetical protein